MSGNTVWIIDGATGLADRTFVAGEGETDASWLTTRMHHAFLRHTGACAEDLKSLLVRVSEDVRAEFDAAASAVPENPWEWPVAAVTVVHQKDRTLFVANLADCAFILRSGNDFIEWSGDPRHHETDKRSLLAQQEIRKAYPDATLPDLMQMVYPVIREGRSRTNTEGGYGVFSLARSFADKVLLESYPLEPDSEILLMTDGFYVLRDPYKAYGPAEMLLAAGQEGGLERMGSALREIEDNDPEAKMFQRFKKHDDASAILLTL